MATARTIPTITPDATRNADKLYLYLRTLEQQLQDLAVSAGAEPRDGGVFLDLSRVRSQLEHTGQYPLNVTGLLGTLSDPQLAGLLIVSTEPPASSYPVGTLMVLTGSPDTFKYCKVGVPNTWQAISTSPANMLTTDTNQTPGATVVKTWTAQQIFTGGLTSAGGLNVTAGQFTSASQFGAYATTLTPQSITTATLTAITFDLEIFDRGACHSTSSNTARITVPVGGDGLWLFTGQIAYAASGAGVVRLAALRGNGATYVARHYQPPVNSVTLLSVINVSSIRPLVAGDYIELIGYQDSGGNLNTDAADGGSTFLVGYRLC